MLLLCARQNIPKYTSFILCGMKNLWNVILVYQISINSTSPEKSSVGFSADLLR